VLPTARILFYPYAFAYLLYVSSLRPPAALEKFCIWGLESGVWCLRAAARSFAHIPAKLLNIFEYFQTFLYSF
jgi:hypothetical protein